MTKKQSLATALQTFDRTPNSATEVSDPALVSRPRLKAQAPSRRGKKALIGYFDPGVSKQLKLLALKRTAPFNSYSARHSTCSFKRGASPGSRKPSNLERRQLLQKLHR